MTDDEWNELTAFARTPDGRRAAADAAVAMANHAERDLGDPAYTPTYARTPYVQPAATLDQRDRTYVVEAPGADPRVVDAEPYASRVRSAMRSGCPFDDAVSRLRMPHGARFTLSEHEVLSWGAYDAITRTRATVSTEPAQEIAGGIRLAGNSAARLAEAVEEAGRRMADSVDRAFGEALSGRTAVHAPRTRFGDGYVVIWRPSNDGAAPQATMSMTSDEMRRACAELRSSLRAAPSARLGDVVARLASVPPGKSFAVSGGTFRDWATADGVPRVIVGNENHLGPGDRASDTRLLRDPVRVDILYGTGVLRPSQSARIGDATAYGDAYERTAAPAPPPPAPAPPRLAVVGGRRAIALTDDED